ncbi:MAG: MFS transporter [Gammaproteobacteria bacterium]|nr:MFS transporter [Gammaproteobacteria bacterium]
MPVTLVVTLSVLCITALFGRYLVKLPKNVWLLFVAQPLAMSASSMMVLAGGLLATKIAPSPDFATLPLTILIAGIALAVFPAAALMKRLGRRVGTMIGLSLGVLGALLAMQAAIDSIFLLLNVGAGLLGASIAFVAQMRFAAIESLASPDDSPKAISVLMVAGIFAAILGPEVAVYGKSLIESPHGYAGSFLGLACLFIISIVVISQLDPIEVVSQTKLVPARSTVEIIRQPIFIIAVSAAALGFSVMSYVMTATPLSMNVIDQLSLESTKWVIQSHIAAMYLPSFLSVFLIRILGLGKLMLCGGLLFLAVLVVALSGQQIIHYWWAMVLLGIGWNFLYTSGTLLLPQTYGAGERFKVQAINDFTVFFCQAAGSLLAGVILFNFGWHPLIWLTVPMMVAIFVISSYYLKLAPVTDTGQNPAS